MKAVLSHAPGGPETLRLEDAPDPEAGAGQVLIEVAAVGVNFPDVLIIEDKYQFKPARPFSPGAELAGTVSAVGEGVSGFAKGDRVLAMTGWGAMAEKVAAPAEKAVKIPDAMPFDEAAAFLMTYGTSYHALADRARLKPGETLLVLGAGGGVGLAAVELGVAMGARVIAAASSEAKLEPALAAGAAEGVVYTSGELDRDAQKALTDRFKAVCGKDGADVIYDPVGGPFSEASLRAIAWEGRFLVVGFPAGIAKLPLNLPLLKGCDVQGVFWGDFVRRNPARHAEEVEELFALYAAGKIRPRIHARFPLDQAAEALRELSGRKAVGKVVVTVKG